MVGPTCQRLIVSTLVSASAEQLVRRTSNIPSPVSGSVPQRRCILIHDYDTHHFTMLWPPTNYFKMARPWQMAQIRATYLYKMTCAKLESIKWASAAQSHASTSRKHITLSNLTDHACDVAEQHQCVGSSCMPGSSQTNVIGKEGNVWTLIGFEYIWFYLNITYKEYSKIEKNQNDLKWHEQAIIIQNDAGIFQILQNAIPCYSMLFPDIPSVSQCCQQHRATWSCMSSLMTRKAMHDAILTSPPWGRGFFKPLHTVKTRPSSTWGVLVFPGTVNNTTFPGLGPDATNGMGLRHANHINHRYAMVCKHIQLW